MNKSRAAQSDRAFQWVVLLALAAIAVLLTREIYPRASATFHNPVHDIYYTYYEGRAILEGVNPYARTLDGDRRTNDKYPTYLPGSYCISALSQLLGLRDYARWIDFWFWVFQACHYAIALLLFREARRRADTIFAIFVAVFWLYNRWTLYIVTVSHVDFCAILLVLWSLILLPRRPRLAALLFGASLAIKHIAIFLLPMFPIWVWHTRPPERRLRASVQSALWALSLPAAFSLPFFAWNPKAFIWSITFSVTREPDDTFATQTIDALLQQVGLVARIPLLLMMVLIFVFAIQRRINRYAAATLVFVVFINFNTVLFQQYMAWFLPFLVMALLDSRLESPPAQAEEA